MRLPCLTASPMTDIMLQSQLFPDVAQNPGPCHVSPTPSPPNLPDCAPASPIQDDMSEYKTSLPPTPTPATTSTSTPSPAPAPAPAPAPRPTRRRAGGATRVKRTQCEYCSKTFSRVQDAQRHAAACAVRPDNKGVECPECGAVLSRVDAAQRHWRGHENPTCEPPEWALRA
jgi:hypothetical protein